MDAAGTGILVDLKPPQHIRLWFTRHNMGDNMEPTWLSGDLDQLCKVMGFIHPLLILPPPAH